MASFALVDEYHQLPGVCYLCKASKRSADEQIMDTGIHIDFEGRVYVCGTCIREMAVVCGLSVQRFEPLQEATVALEAELDRERARADEFEGRYNQILDAVAERLTTPTDSIVEPYGEGWQHEATLSPETAPRNKGGRPRLPRDERGQIIR